MAVGESADYDLNWELRNVGFKIKKLEIDTSGGLLYKDKKLTATRIGPLSLQVTIFNGDKKERYEVIVAKGHGYTSMPGEKYISGAVEIRTAQELAAIDEDLSGKYILKDDIDLSGYGEWTPIGTNKAFEGSLVNPYGYKITNLRIESEIFRAGLFADIRGSAYLDGLILENVYIDNSGSENVSVAGGIAGSIWYQQHDTQLHGKGYDNIAIECR